MKTNKGGFTLVELLAVIAIIGILSALVVGLAGTAQKDAARKRAEAEIGQLESFITEYKTQYGKVPSTEKALEKALSDAKHSLTNMMDPWDEEYHYEPSSKQTFYLWSTAGGTNREAWIGNPPPAK